MNMNVRLPFLTASSCSPYKMGCYVKKEKLQAKVKLRLQPPPLLAVRGQREGI